jgi:MFS family permease
VTASDQALPAANGVWEPGQRLLTVGLILIVTVVASEAMAVATVMPQVEHHLGDIGLYGWVFSAFFLGNLVGIVVTGRACDRVRPFIPFAIGLTLFVVGLIGAGSARSMLMLVLARALQGLGAGAMPAVAYVCVGRQYAPQARPRMFALLSTAWVVPSLLAPPVAAVVGSHFGWKWVFLGLVPVAVLCGVVVLRSVAHVDTPANADEGGTTLRDALLVAAGAGLALAGLDQPHWYALVPMVAVGVALGLPAFRRLTPPGTLTARRGIAAAIAIRGILTFAFFQADAYVTLTLTTVRGAATIVGGVAMTACSLWWTVGSWVQERRIGRHGPRPLVAGGLVCVGLGIALLLATLVDGVPVWLGIVAWSVGGLGIGVAYSPLSVTTLAEAEPGKEGGATAALQLSDVLGVALGTGVGGVVIGAWHRAGRSPKGALAVVFLIALAASICGAALAHRLPRRVMVAPSPEEGEAPLDRLDDLSAHAHPLTSFEPPELALTESSQGVRRSITASRDRAAHEPNPPRSRRSEGGPPD